MPKSVLQEGKDIQLASTLISLGARLQIAQVETGISHERLLKLFRELRARPPSRGMMPFSTDWFMAWLPNIHASAFYNIHLSLRKPGQDPDIRTTIKAYKLYAGYVTTPRSPTDEPLLSFTRAWVLVRFFGSRMLDLAECDECRGRYVIHAHDPKHAYVCGLCRPFTRAAKTPDSTGRAMRSVVSSDFAHTR